MSLKCPHCERGDLESRVVDETIRYDESDLSVPGIQISVCPTCYEEIVLPEQARANELRFADAKRKHDGLLVSSEIVAWRKKHRLSQAEAAKLLGGGANAFSKYERGEVIQSRAMDLLMRASQAIPAVLSFLKAEADCNEFDGWEVAEVVVSLKRHVKASTGKVTAVNEAQWSADPNYLGLVVNG